MHPFPPEGELQFLVGETLCQVVLDPYGVTLVFDSGRRIVCEEALDYTDPTGATYHYECEAVSSPPVRFHNLIGRKTTSVTRDDLRLTLSFESGAQIIIYSEIGMYESGQIYFGTHTDTDTSVLKIIVF